MAIDSSFESSTLPKILPIAELLRAYHRHEVYGLNHIPKSGPAIIAVNHSLATYDTLLLWVAVYHEHDRMIRALVDRLFFKIPYLSELMTHFGTYEGSPQAAKRLLSEGHLVCVAPGGMKEALKPTPAQRYQIDWDQRRGFAKLAVENQVPVILAACPKADDLYSVAPSKITSFVYEKFRIPLFFAKGFGLTPIPRPVKLIHTLSERIYPPLIVKTDDLDAATMEFHEILTKRMKSLMQEALSYE